MRFFGFFLEGCTHESLLLAQYNQQRLQGQCKFVSVRPLGSLCLGSAHVQDLPQRRRERREAQRELRRIQVKRILISAFLIVCFLEIAVAQSLSADEKKIVNYVDAHMTDAISLLERVVNIESASQNVAGVKSVGSVFKSEFEALGMKARWIDMPPEMERAGHLVAETSGARGKRLTPTRTHRYGARRRTLSQGREQSVRHRKL